MALRARQMMNEVVRSKKGMGYLFNVVNRLRVGGEET